MTDRTWYVFRVFSPHLRHGHGVQERWAAEMLSNLGYKAFTPLEERQRSRRGCKSVRRVETKCYPMMPGYVLIGFDGPVNWLEILSIPFVKSVIGSDGLPRPVPPQGVLHLQTISHTSVPHNVSVITRKSFVPGDAVRINEGAFAGWESRVEDIRGNEAIVLVQLFNQEHKRKVPLENLEAA